MISVVISVKEFESMMEMLDELEDVRIYDKAKLSDDPSIPIDEAFELIESLRKEK